MKKKKVFYFKNSFYQYNNYYIRSSAETPYAKTWGAIVMKIGAFRRTFFVFEWADIQK